MNPTEILSDLLSDKIIREPSFSEEFLTRISVADVKNIVTDMKKNYGSFLGAYPLENKFSLHFERAKVPTQITLNAKGQIIGLWFDAPVAEGGIKTHLAEITKLSGQTSVLISSDGKIMGSHAPDEILAVGSAGKLVVLLALKRKILAGELALDDVVHLNPHWKSLPSGQLQDWPDDTTLTLATLSHLMISVSDNTATDALIDIVGREAIEAITPLNTPFITTREMFILKTEEHANLRSLWRKGDVEDRRQILEQIKHLPSPPINSIVDVISPELNWQMSARELCNFLEEIADMTSASINPGLAVRKDWETVVYKGGSDFGVLNLSTRMIGKNGTAYTVVATWNNDSALNHEKLMAPYCGILSRLAESELQSLPATTP